MKGYDFLERYGYIYVITNNLTGKQYVGQTSRDIWIRFEEHRTPSKVGNSDLHKDIQTLGYQNFSIKELEKVPLDKLDERECYWINKLDTFYNGYNQTKGGQSNYYKQYLKGILIVEKNMKIQSRNYLAKKISELTSWSYGHIFRLLYFAIHDNKEFLGYHIKEFDVTKDDIFVDEDVLEDWIKTLNIRYTGKHIYSPELDIEFDSAAAACRYIVDNDLYIGNSKYPLRELATAINKVLKEKTKFIKSKKGPLTFLFVPGKYKKQAGATSFDKKHVYCPQLDMKFNSQTEAAKYFVDNKIWGSIKLKTARLRISDVVRGYFPDYKGYTFQHINEE